MPYLIQVSHPSDSRRANANANADANVKGAQSIKGVHV
jgi:hypothetical protein